MIYFFNFLRWLWLVRFIWRVLLGGILRSLVINDVSCNGFLVVRVHNDYLLILALSSLSPLVGLTVVPFELFLDVVVTWPGWVPHCGCWSFLLGWGIFKHLLWPVPMLLGRASIGRQSAWRLWVFLRRKVLIVLSLPVGRHTLVSLLFLNKVCYFAVSKIGAHLSRDLK